MRVELTNPMLGDKLRTLSVEYDLPEELLVNVAVKRLVDEIGRASCRERVYWLV